MSRSQPSSSLPRVALAAVAVAFALAPAASPADQAKGPATAGSSLTRIKLPDLGTPATANRVAAASRGVAGAGAPDAEPLKLTLLVPEQTAFAASADPMLYWHASAAADQPVMLTLNDVSNGELLLEVELGERVRAGINDVDLGEFGIRLQPGREYDWWIAVVSDPTAHSSDLAAGAVVRRIEPDAALAAKLAGADGATRVHRLAEAGLWYDALAAASELIEARPDEPAYRELRAALLDGAELPELAAADRAGAMR